MLVWFSVFSYMNYLSFQISKAWFYPTCSICPTSSPLRSHLFPPNSNQTHLLMVFHMKPIIAFMLLFMVAPTPGIYSTNTSWVLCARHCSRLLEYINKQNWWKFLPSWNWSSRMDVLSPFAPVNWPQPWQSSSVPSSYPEWSPSHTDRFLKPHVLSTQTFSNVCTLKHTDIF